MRRRVRREKRKEGEGDEVTGKRRRGRSDEEDGKRRKRGE